MDIIKDGEQFCCIALTNPSEVVIVARSDKSLDYREMRRGDDENLYTPGEVLCHVLKVNS